MEEEKEGVMARTVKPLWVEEELWEVDGVEGEGKGRRDGSQIADYSEFFQVV